MQILGIDVGGSGIKAAPVDTRKGVLTAERHRLETPLPATPDAMAETIHHLAEHFAWRGLIGCAFPARVQQGVARTATNIDPSWIGTSVENVFADATGCPVRAINDADAAGVAEITFGAGHDVQGLVLMITVGTGIGTALFINGHLVPNMEFGLLRYKGDIIEKYASDRARKVNDLSWEAWARRFQEFLTYIEDLVAPDLIILGGGSSKPKRFEKFKNLLHTRAELRPAVLANNAGIIGAAAFAAKHFG